MNNKCTDISFDKNNIWHPYTSLADPLPSYLVKSASGTKLILDNGKEYLCTIDTIDHFTNLSKLSRLCIRIKISGRGDELMTN